MGIFGLYPLSLLTAFAASSPKGEPLGTAGNFIATAKSRPLGEGGIAAGDDGGGNPTLRKEIGKKMSKSVDKSTGVWYYT